jgi:hypothetical protein
VTDRIPSLRDFRVIRGSSSSGQEAWARFTDDGQLCEIGQDGVAWPLAEPSFGCSLRRSWNDKQPDRLTPCHAAQVEEDADSLLVTVNRLRDEAGSELAASVTIRWTIAEGLLHGQLVNADFPDDLRPAAFVFPDISCAYGKDDQLVLPNDIGLLIEDAGHTLFDRPGAPKQLRSRVHMQFLAWLRQGQGLYLDSRDTASWTKSILVTGDGGTVTLRIEHFLPQPAAGPIPLPAYPVSIGTFPGSWYEAAQLYRPWALRQHWASRGPAERQDTYVAQIACWLWNRGRCEEVGPATKEVADRLGLPVALDWYWWHKHAYDTSYPDYFPPRDGEDTFRATVADLQESGVAVQVYTNGMSWDEAEPDWERHGKPCTQILPDGSLHGVVYNTWMNARLMHVCGASSGWRHKELEVAQQAAALGLDGLYIDQIAVIGGQRPCFSTEHGHDPGGGTFGATGFRELFQGLRAANPGLAISSESVSEIYQDLLDACITLQTSWERLHGKAGTTNRQPIPLFQAVYHGHSVVFGNYAHIDGIPPYDEFWPDEGRPDPARERDWHALCPDQFPLEIARTVAFGCQPLVTNLTRAHLASDTLAPDVAFFLDLARFYHAHRPWLLWGDMLPPATIETAQLDVTCIQRGIFTKPDAIEPFTVPRPAVLHSAWLAPDGQAGLVLVNYTRTPQPIHITPPTGYRLDAQPEQTLPPRTALFLKLSQP